MRTIFALFIAALVASTATKANAQFGGLLGKSFGFREGEASGTYQSNNQIRTFISAKPYAPIDLYEKVIIKAAEMTDAKDFPRFGVTKVNCSTMLMNGSPVAKSCYVIAVMVKDGDQVKPRGKRQVQYYDVSEVQAGKIAPPSE